MTDRTHLNALEFGLHNEQVRLRNAKSDGEIALRTVWVRQYKEQIATERTFLGLPAEDDLPEMSLEDILAELE